MKDLDQYSHLNESDIVVFSIPETAKIVTELNYGSVRFLTEILKLRESSDNMKYEIFNQHTQQLRELIESGWY